MGIDDAHAAPLFNILTSAMLNEAGFAAAGGTHNMHVLQSCPDREAHRTSSTIPAEDDRGAVNGWNDPRPQRWMQLQDTLPYFSAKV